MNIDKLHYFDDQTLVETPNYCNDVFHGEIHPLTQHAVNLVQQFLILNAQNLPDFHQAEAGKMFGVLLCSDKENKIGYLAGFSGMLDQKWSHDYFVPPVFDEKQMSQLMTEGELKLAEFTTKIKQLKQNELRIRLMNELNVLKDEAQSKEKLLIQHNKNNKNQRKINRNTLNSNHQNDIKTSLQELSLQSQQDKKRLKALRLENNKRLEKAHNKLSDLFDDEIETLVKHRKQLSQSLQKQVFQKYVLINGLNENNSIDHFFEENLPPSGAGDCAAPKLIQYAHNNQLNILGLSEFWWGASPKKEIRHHKFHYQPCRSRCHKILPFMLEGVPTHKKHHREILIPDIVFEDEEIVIINKPAGLLSIPGKEEKHSVSSWLKTQYPNTNGSLLIHRLDQATSGLLIAAKSSESFKFIQKQFIERAVKKRYVALLSGKMDHDKRIIDLPLRVDLDDRPRQLVCYEHGKTAQTKVKLIRYDNEMSRVYFYPITGRTHQLRVHSAHHLGLNLPIVGDELYGLKANRLMLHAEKIEFIHPKTKKVCQFSSKVPF